GKSTLLKIVAGVLPFESGERVPGHNVSLHYYAQHQLDALNPRNTALEELAAIADVEMQPRLRAILGAFLFSGDDVEKPVAVLSGGEKSRLALAKMLLRPANLLCLDEPTNHLDVTAREILEEALDQFDGTMLFISHDRYFINRIATKVVEVREGRLWEYAGDYDYYLEKREPTPEPRAGSREPRGDQRVSELVATQGVPGSRQLVGDKGRAPSAVQGPGATDRRREGSGKSRERDGRRADAEARKHKNRELAPLRTRLKELEAEIAKIEARTRDLTDQMANPDLYRDGERAREVARERKALEEQAATLYGKWEELALRLESATGGDPR
ncbi:MAG TPA: ATP-binding cassette domain-containing protein, partial [Candidatus Methylomirabilis sp.]|nr:ATP-binding cassette domain-containing protein [Candidatus Methylomirabilis sp.]